MMRKPLTTEIVAAMSGAAINKALDQCDALASKTCQELIDAGRGRERAQETYRMSDPLALRFIAEVDARAMLRREVDRRYGPGAPSRLPRGFGPIRGRV